MKESDWLRWSGMFGLAFVVLYVVSFALFFSAGQPPTISDAGKFAEYIAKNQTAFLVAAWLLGLAVACNLIWLTGVRGIIRGAGPDWEWAAALSFGTGIAVNAVAVIADGLSAAAAIDTTTKTEPVAVKVLFESSALIYGTVIWFVAALLVALLSYVTTRTAVLPGWTAWVGYVAAALNLVTTFSIFGGGEPGGFFTATGLAGIVIGLLPFLVWITCVSIVMMAARGVRAPVVAARATR